MFKKLLIANRGEIAVRIIRACRELGVGTVAVYSEADRHALHVRYADEAYCIGPAPAAQSYLRIDKLIEAAHKAGADALHPGYGFLSENQELARACQEAGLTFAGPPAEAIRAMGDKVTARKVVEAAGVPVVPGTADLDSQEDAEREAPRVGFPILIKASAGGGGKGMRAVFEPGELAQALEAARREAMSAFGDSRIYLERYLNPVRHIEAQVMADKFGNVVFLGERECSIQRRHQKLIEEAPSPAVTDDLRRRLSEIAIVTAKATSYHSAGTVECLLDQEGNFYFIEMNTRIQVEHPVTEMVTGFDLVAEQIRIAAGEPLSFRQEDVKPRGWSIECRISSEDPANNFLPSVGHISFLREPAGPGIRVDSGLYEGQEVSVYYDPLLAKVIVWGQDRDEAIRRMQGALHEFRVMGVHTNIPFHLQIMESERFKAGDLSTSFLEDHFSPDGGHEEESDLPFVLAAVLSHRRRPPAYARAASDGADGAWRMAGRRRAQPRPGWSAGWRRST